jgi:hypothetical protein
VLGPKLSIHSTYTDAIETAQAAISRTFSDLLDQEGDLSIGVPTGPLLPNPDIPDSTFRERLLTGEVIYQFGTRKVGLAGEMREREIFSLAAEERTVAVGIKYDEDFARDINYVVQVSVSDTIEALPLKPLATSVSASADGFYEFLPDLIFGAGYVWQKEFRADGTAIPQNVLRFTVEKKF